MIGYCVIVHLIEERERRENPINAFNIRCRRSLNKIKRLELALADKRLRIVKKLVIAT